MPEKIYRTRDPFFIQQAIDIGDTVLCHPGSSYSIIIVSPDNTLDDADWESHQQAISGRFVG